MCNLRDIEKYSPCSIADTQFKFLRLGEITLGRALQRRDYHCHFISLASEFGFSVYVKETVHSSPLAEHDLTVDWKRHLLGCTFPLSKFGDILMEGDYIEPSIDAGCAELALWHLREGTDPNEMDSDVHATLHYSPFIRFLIHIENRYHRGNIQHPSFITILSMYSNYLGRGADVRTSFPLVLNCKPQHGYLRFGSIASDLRRRRFKSHLRKPYIDSHIRVYAVAEIECKVLLTGCRPVLLALAQDSINRWKPKHHGFSVHDIDRLPPPEVKFLVRLVMDDKDHVTSVSSKFLHHGGNSFRLLTGTIFEGENTGEALPNTCRGPEIPSELDPSGAQNNVLLLEDTESLLHFYQELPEKELDAEETIRRMITEGYLPLGVMDQQSAMEVLISPRRRCSEERFGPGTLSQVDFSYRPEYDELMRAIERVTEKERKMRPGSGSAESES
ncbi:hypothetical protein BCR34DRAFT_586047 [Clohesyomyces aquaticus]|uniref:Uncharacterized protein n=1 Tax=Clohesyomyces aquaticus TaxID=1231657 RepID=A0A1Y1ZUV3_9PLEO|nr:hypothetical protein BCR34DRAFT_586047 [Clohesyomyces aquaticus]